MSAIVRSGDDSMALREPARRVERTRRMLVAGAAFRAILLGAAGALAIVAAAVLVDVASGVPRRFRELVVPIAILAGLATTVVLLYGHRRILSTRRVARWIEERHPELGFALLTALDRETPDDARQELERPVAAVHWEAMVGQRIRSALAAPAALVGVLGALILSTPASSRARVTAPTPGDILESRRPADDDAVDPLSPLVVTIEPPPYTRRPGVTIENPLSIAGLAGSTVTLGGRASAVLPAVTIDSSFPSVTMHRGRWSAAFRMPRQPTVVRLRHHAAQRMLVLEPVADSAPVIALQRPAADTVFIEPMGIIAFEAAVRDDIGIAAAGIEYIVSSGSGESFTFRSGTLGPVGGNGRTSIDMTTRVSLDSLHLAPGDVVHFRVFARDNNTVSGPSTGFSETRAIRIARPDERDSVAVDAAPPAEVDGSLVSQRMLIILTEALQARRARLARAELVGESRRIAADQKRLRRSVGDIIFTRLGSEPDVEHVHGPGDAHEAGDLTPAELLRAAERANRSGSRSDPLDFHGDESPVVAINRPLLEAYNHMWDASRELDVGEPGRALPPMRAALAAIQRARQAERIYLRGRAAPIIVDVADVRLQGKDTGSESHRSSRAPLERQRDLDRFGRAIAMLGTATGAGVDSLLLLRVELLATHPVAARTLGEAIDELRAGRDATGALARARRSLLGEPALAPGLGRWSGGW